MYLKTLTVTINEDQSEQFRANCNKYLVCKPFGMYNSDGKHITYKITIPSHLLKPFISSLQVSSFKAHYKIEDFLHRVDTLILDFISKSIPRFRDTELNTLISELIQYYAHFNFVESMRGDLSKFLSDLFEDQILLVHGTSNLIYTNNKSPEGIESLKRTNHSLISSQILNNVRKHEQLIRQTLKKVQSHQYDLIYRVFHHSFKAYYIQNSTKHLFNIIKLIKPPNVEINPSYLKIYREGLMEFKGEHNQNWLDSINPQILSYSYSKFLIEALLQSLEEIPKAQEPTNLLPPA